MERYDNLQHISDKEYASLRRKAKRLFKTLRPTLNFDREAFLFCYRNSVDGFYFPNFDLEDKLAAIAFVSGKATPIYGE